MYDYVSAFNDKIAFYNQPQYLDDPYHPAGFKGTWAFSNHSTIPEIFHGFLQRHFGQYRIRRIPIKDINEIMNEVWDGPGSLEKIFSMELEYMQSGKEVKFTASDIAAIKAKSDTDIEDEVPASNTETEYDD